MIFVVCTLVVLASTLLLSTKVFQLLLSFRGCGNGSLVTKRRAVVLVGGDFARSPRMQYHARSLLQSSLFFEVVLVGLAEGNLLCEALQSKLGSDDPICSVIDKMIPSLGENSGFIWRTLFKLGNLLPQRRLRWLIVTCIRVFYYVISYWGALSSAFELTVTRKGVALIVSFAGAVVCQTPPAVPFIPLVKVARCFAGLQQAIIWFLAQRAAPLLLGPVDCDLLNSVASSQASPRLIVDWHNFGFTLLRIDNRPDFVVRFYRLCEKWLCGGDVNLTVSKAMSRALQNEGARDGFAFRLKMPIHVLYDCAPDFFRRSSARDLLKSLKDEVFPLRQVPSWFVAQANSGQDERNSAQERGLFVVSSTSWGTDDDYSMVLKALRIIDTELQQHSNEYSISNIWLVVTGKGQTRARFEEQLLDANLSPRIAVHTVYFQRYADYSSFLGAADLGLSVHFSSSGLDLPMKCVDMLGAGLPVLSIAYDAIGELVTEDKGWLFRNEKELASIFLEQLMVSRQNDVLTKKRKFVFDHREKWEDAWRSVVLPLLR